MRMEGKEYLNRISRETAMQIAGRELPQVETVSYTHLRATRLAKIWEAG